MQATDHIENISEALAVNLTETVYVDSTNVHVVDDEDVVHGAIVLEASDPYDDEAYFTRFPPVKSDTPTLEFISFRRFYEPQWSVTNERPSNRDAQLQKSQAVHAPHSIRNTINDTVSSARRYAGEFFNQSSQSNQSRAEVEENQLVIYSGAK
jgi:hypothetical protein